MALLSRPPVCGVDITRPHLRSTFMRLERKMQVLFEIASPTLGHLPTIFPEHRESVSFQRYCESLASHPFMLDFRCTAIMYRAMQIQFRARNVQLHSLSVTVHGTLLLLAL